jgi:hypothetical protein
MPRGKSTRPDALKGGCGFHADPKAQSRQMPGPMPQRAKWRKIAEMEERDGETFTEEEAEAHLTTDGPNKPYFKPTEIPDILPGCIEPIASPHHLNKFPYKLTALGYATITRLAAHARHPRTIAHVLGIPYKTYDQWLDKDELMMDARDFGIACLLDRFADRLLKAGDSGNIIALIFQHKLMGVNPDKDPPKITNNFFHLTLNDSMSVEEYKASLGAAQAQAQQTAILTEGASVPQTSDVPQLAEHVAPVPPDWLDISAQQEPVKVAITDPKLMPKLKTNQHEDSVR